MTNNSQGKKIAIIGAGFGGLAAAYDLVRAGHSVTMFDTADHVGGLSAGFKEPHWDWTVERYYHHWFASDRHILNLIDELGLRNNVIYPRPYTVMYYKGNFYPFDSVLQAMLFPGLGWGVNKIRFGLVGLYLRLTENWKSLESITVDKWMRRWAGNQVYNTMWQPMMIGKFGEEYAKQVNMAWMWARIHARTTRLGTYKGGFQVFANDFSALLQEKGVQIQLSTAIKQIVPESAKTISISTTTGSSVFEKVLCTTSPATLAQLAPSLPREYSQGLLNLKSMGAITLILVLKHQLSQQGYYWFNLPKDAGFPFLALVEHTNFVSPDHYGGDHIVYIGDYKDADHEYFDLSKEELFDRFLPSLPRFNQKFKPDWVRTTHLFRTPYAQPVPLLNHSKNIPPIKTPIPGLFFASMSQVYPWDRGTNFAVEIARKAAKAMLEE